MNRLVISLLLSLILIYGSESYVEFCDLRSLTNVFNVGHFVHMVRCNETWTFDPRMNDGKGGFIRDYSWFSYARKKLIEIKKIGELGKRFKNFRFAAFSFHEISCDQFPENGDNYCIEAAPKWNNWGVIVFNRFALSLKYEYEIQKHNVSVNQLGGPLHFMEKEENLDSDSLGHAFWPNLNKLTTKWLQTYRKIDFQRYHSALYSPHDHLLYMVIELHKYDERNSTEYCLTYIDLFKHLFDSRNLPKERQIQASHSSNVHYDWNPLNCFSGHVIGMFYDERDHKPYLVGRIDDITPVFEDQVYKIEDVQERGMAALKSLYDSDHSDKVRNNGKPRNIRQYFGCVTKTTENTTSNSRKKRAIKERQPLNRFSWKAIQQELRDDWIKLSIMSNSVLFLLYLIFRLSKN